VSQPNRFVNEVKKIRLKENSLEIRKTLICIDRDVIGDRAADVQTASEIGGTGILIPFENQPDEDKKVKNLKANTASISLKTYPMRQSI
jgi:hypothetical protein